MKRLSIFPLGISLLTLLLLGAPSHAQSRLPDFGASEFILQQQRERELREQMEERPSVHLEAQQEELPQLALQIPEEEHCYTIHAIELNGDLAPKFQWALKAAHKDPTGQVDSATNRCLGAEGINIVMSRVQNAIIQKGYVTTRIVAAPQNLEEGVLLLTLIPGRVGAIRWAENTKPRTSWRSALPMREGDLLNLRDLEQGLEMFKRVPTADADIQIEPSEEVGQSDLVVQWEQKFPFRLNFSVDDGGSKNTGRYQGAVTFSYDNWLTLNDLFYFSINHELGDGQGGNSRGHALHYSIPIRGNWLLSLNGSTYKYEQIIPGVNQDYTYSGDSTNYDVTLSRRFIRTSTLSSNVYVKGWSRYSNNFIDGSEIQVQKRRTAGWELGADLRQYIGRSILNAGVSYKRGTGANGALRAAEEEYGGGTSRMKILSVNATLNSPFQIGNQRFRYFGTFRGQWNNTRLVAQDQFSIGGRYTVRGFDGVNNLMGERGILLRNDLGWVVPKLEQEVYLGVDYGQTSGPSSREQVGNALMGTVIGIRGGFPATKYGYLSYDLFGGTWLKKPTGFKTSKYTGGFNLNLSF